MKYNRVVIKLSGQAMAGDDGFGFDAKALAHLAAQIRQVRELGVQIAVVVGGGNVFRGNRSDSWGIDRVEADNIGMLGTVINSLLLRGKLSASGEDNVRVMTAIPINAVAEPFLRLRAKRHLDKDAILIFSGGNGQPFITTDYPSVQRALEIGADALLVAKHGVDGVYDTDPRKNPDAHRYERLPYDEVLSRRLAVMDQTAFILARDHGLPLHVFDIERDGLMAAICRGEHHGTEINSDIVEAEFAR
ncbi:Uridine monophosphate kinase [Pseudonocardia sp. Ae168_Ps1]|jgi:uridylate kinase|uniref:UMP kinase n=1 Tax=unclassified Pseudonocardia TaxID=2619320 RepID=UPI0001FFF220|nr:MULTISPECIES: UMP kinase [unclassified Pseudonocardia]OLL72078.1 Uridine monophosphate kinase [Pseudonocardia sp. Ae150A_Ps1]OLL78044.1 Uridine monophosphate kinase [Pseudonocardia sp. Ae168_Ps1]OLL87831.1 Uridine monophosphate kinase [Pseudonocardia sp. Ae263_Ps1]OLL92143.1 Uridine monophosphate kinase [Pseudonocardia sp. Ae356_Ps1]OLM18685.1 Uridine monophosphate kinase [Pseudonocardia sp. Ae707_Ps1]